MLRCLFASIISVITIKRHRLMRALRYTLMLNRLESYKKQEVLQLKKRMF